ncbi:MAG: polysaccharide biosynthesis tyrosine autokinase [Paludibacter sp.]|nr:polysaccharide biosynthesis tyrosine autokinase [Paludibacter sp.]
MNKNINVEELEQLMVEKPIDWRELIEKYLVYWKWILASVIFTLIIGGIYFRTQPDKFLFKSTLLITDNSSGGQVSQMSILKQLDVIGMSAGSSNIYNEKQVIHSKELIKKVVNELKLHTTYTKTSFLKPIELYATNPVEVVMDYADILKIGKPLKLSVEYNTDGYYQVSGKYTKERNTSRFKYKLNQLPATIKTPAGKIQIMLKNPQILPEDKIYIKISNPISVVKYYQEAALSTEVPKDGDLVNITFKENNIQKGKDFLQRLIDLYNQDAIDQINKSANFTAIFIDSRLELLSNELTNVEQNLQTYKQSNKLTNIEADAELYLQRSNLYDQKRNEHEIQLQLIQYIEEFLKDPANKYALIPNLGLTDVGLVAVIQEYNKLLVTYSRVSEGSSKSNPTLQSMESQIHSSRMAIQNSIATSRKGLQISIRELENQNAFLTSQLKKIPQQEREFLEIKRQQEIKASLYMFLLQKREEASLSMAVTVPKARLLDAADTADKTAPKLPMTLAASLFLGLFLPIGFLYLKFLFTTTFNNRKEVESLTDVPIITELAHQKSDDVVIDHDTNASANAELLRLLRSKLQFIMNPAKDKLLLITSTESGEGKTFVSVNLAVSISLAGKKTLLIGMDLRKPMLASHFAISEQEGLSSYLSGMEDNYQKLIHQSSEFPNLYIFPGGIIPPNPNELILSERLDQLIAELREQYDYILIDSAPVGAVSDTFLINRVSDLTLYVCRADYSDKRNLELLNRVHKENSLNKIHLVVNDVDIEAHKYAGKYGYSYSYGYGYGKKKRK